MAERSGKHRHMKCSLNQSQAVSYQTGTYPSSSWGLWRVSSLFQEKRKDFFTQHKPGSINTSTNIDYRVTLDVPCFQTGFYLAGELIFKVQIHQFSCIISPHFCFIPPHNWVMLCNGCVTARTNCKDPSMHSANQQRWHVKLHQAGTTLHQLPTQPFPWAWRKTWVWSLFKLPLPRPQSPSITSLINSNPTILQDDENKRDPRKSSMGGCCVCVCTDIKPS